MLWRVDASIDPRRGLYPPCARARCSSGAHPVGARRVRRHLRTYATAYRSMWTRTDVALQWEDVTARTILDCGRLQIETLVWACTRSEQRIRRRTRWCRPLAVCKGASTPCTAERETGARSRWAASLFAADPRGHVACDGSWAARIARSLEVPMITLALASFAVTLLPVLIAAGVSSVARAAHAGGVRIPRIMRAGPWCAVEDHAAFCP